MGMWARLGVLLALAGLVLAGGPEANASPGTTTRVSVDSGGDEAEGLSEYPAISADGRYVAFGSFAADLVSGDTQLCGNPPFTYNCPDVFVHDRWTGVTERVSLSSGGAQAIGDSLHPAISADGRYVAFDSGASNLVTGDTNGWADIFVRDRQTATTQRVSVDSSGDQATGGSSLYPAISGDGRYVAFYSDATNLVSTDTNSAPDIFVRDRQAGVTQMLSVSSGGVQGNAGSWDPAVSPDGRYVAFYSEASTLVDNDTDGYQDVFVRDRQAGTTERVSVSSGGVQGTGDSWSPAISADGRYVVFFSFAPDLVTPDGNGASDVFVRDRQLGVTARVSVDSDGDEGDNASYTPAISADGRYVAFQSFATNLVDIDGNGVADVFARDRDTDENGIFDEAGAVSTTRVSVSSFGAEGNGESLDPAISGDGRFVPFESMASNLVPGGDTNGSSDIFLHDREASPVGGIAELPGVASGSGRAEIDFALLAGLAAAALAFLAAGVWCAARRVRQGQR